MDQPRPRPQTPQRATQLPLIIERADLAPAWQRWLAVGLTALAWLIWLMMWLPPWLIIGGDTPWLPHPMAGTLPLGRDALIALLEIVPHLLAIVGLLLALRYLVRRRGKPATRHGAIGLQVLANEAALDPDRLTEWQQARILYVSHGPHGRVVDARGSPPPP